MGCVLSTCCESHWKHTEATCCQNATFFQRCCPFSYTAGQQSDGTSAASCQVNFTAEHQRDGTSTRRCQVNFTAEHQSERFQSRNQSCEQQRIYSEKTQQQDRQAHKQEKCYNTQDPTLKFVDREDEMDFYEEDFKSPRALMSCGHAVTPMSLTKWCVRQLEEGRDRFICGMTKCNAEWTYEEVCKMALLTADEKDYFEKRLFNNIKKPLGVQSCPGCKNNVVRGDPTDLSVKCTECTAKRGRPYVFCWQCLRECEAGILRRDRCENDGCHNPKLTILRGCRDIIFTDVEGVTGCPSIRACPTCGELVEHNKTQCKNVCCPRCKIEFCFVCLKLTTECLKTSDYYTPCSSGVAPRQTSIPVLRTNPPK